MTIIGDRLAQKLAQSLNLNFIFVKEITFPDGEVKPILEKEEFLDKGILFLQKKEKENINSYLIKLYLLLEKLSNLVKELILIIPYFPYARQDKIFQEGEPLSSLYIAKLLEKNVNQIITINYHQHRQKVENLFSKTIINLSAFPYFKKKFQEKNILKNVPLIIGPDEESKNFVKDFIGEENYPYYIFKKTRNIKTGKINFSFNWDDLKNLLKQHKEIYIIDDIISSAQTIIQLQKILLSLNKNIKINLVFVHPILGDQTIKTLKKAGFKKIYTTNTIENHYYFLDIVDPIKNKIKEIINV